MQWAVKFEHARWCGAEAHCIKTTAQTHLHCKTSLGTQVATFPEAGDDLTLRPAGMKIKRGHASSKWREKGVWRAMGGNSFLAAAAVCGKERGPEAPQRREKNTHRRSCSGQGLNYKENTRTRHSPQWKLGAALPPRPCSTSQS